MTELDRVSAIEWLRSALEVIASPQLPPDLIKLDLDYKIRRAKALLEKKE